MIAYESQINIFEEVRYFLILLSKFGLHSNSVFCQSDIVFPELSFSFFDRNKCLHF